MNIRKGNGIKSITLGGIYLALSVIVLYMESLIPAAKLSMYALSSFLAAFVIIESGIKAGWLFYIASSLLALMIIPDKTGLIPYFIFFGNYGIVKYYTERLNNYIFEYVMKFIFFNICLVSAYLFMKALFFENLNNIKLPVYIVAALLQVVFLIYDYAFSLVIHLYNTRIRNRL